jgi:hypothetical protein
MVPFGMVYSSGGFDPVDIKKLLDASYHIHRAYQELHQNCTKKLFIETDVTSTTWLCFLIDCQEND